LSHTVRTGTFRLQYEHDIVCVVSGKYIGSVRCTAVHTIFNNIPILLSTTTSCTPTVLYVLALKRK
jgi:hypothetical protein